MIALQNLYGPLQEDKLIEQERIWGFEYPADYRKFLLQYNGAEPEENVAFHIEEEPAGGGSNLKLFLGINGIDYADLLDHLKTYNGRLPKWLHPIAYDSFGNLICIGVVGPNCGKVYFWDHEMEADEDQGITPDDAGNIYLIANSFAEFLECLYEPPPLTEEDMKGAEIIR